MAIVKGLTAKPAQATVKTATGDKPINYGDPLGLDPSVRILLIGDTGSGKTSQIGMLAEYIMATENKPTILFTGDKGGYQPIKPYIEEEIIIPVAYDGVTDPWIWVAHALKGETKIDGRWVNLVQKYGAGLLAEEGLTAFAEMFLMNLSEHSANNPNQAVGGDSAWTFEAKEGDEVIKIASNTMSHYGVAQLQVMHEIWKHAPGVPSIWTAILKRAQDSNVGGGILGAQAVGSSLTPSIPRWFDYTFRINALPAENGPAKHVLYLETHLDKQAKGAKVVANARLPLAGAEGAPVEAVFDPADIVTALLKIRRRNEVARMSIKDRIAMIRGARKEG